MKDNNDSKKNLFNESQKENDDPMKSETLLLKSSRVSNIEKEKHTKLVLFETAFSICYNLY